MKKNILVGGLLLFLIICISGISLSQDQIIEDKNLAKTMKKYYQLADPNYSNRGEIIVYKFNGSIGEALGYAENSLVEDRQVPPIEIDRFTLGEEIFGLINIVEQGYLDEFYDGWIEKAKKTTESLDLNIEQMKGYTSINFEGVDREITVESPFFDPLSLTYADGIYITYIKFQEWEEDYKKVLGNRIKLDNKFDENFLKGTSIIKDKEIKEDEEDDEFGFGIFKEKIPEATIKIGDLVGNIRYEGIDDVYYIFSGYVEIDGQRFDANENTDPGVYESSGVFIRLVKEEGMDYKLEITVSREDGLFLDLSSDLNRVYENGMEVNIMYQGLEDSYNSEEYEVDYLVRK